MEVLGLIAVLLSPLIALQVSDVLQQRRERRQRKVHVFRTLMATRAAALAPDHVQALNVIDVEFYGSDAKSKAVREAWKAYLDHLNTGDAGTDVWGARRQDLLVDLLYEMAKLLSYDFDKTHIRRHSYFPKGHGDIEADQLLIRKGLVSILNGEASFPIFLTGMNQPETPADAQGKVGPGTAVTKP